MGAWALPWPPLLLALLTVLPGQSPGATAQVQVCSVDKTFLQVEENSNITEPLVNISIPEGQQVTLGPSSTPSAFRILGNQLFLNVIPDYEEDSMLEAHLECRRGDTVVTQLRVFVVVLDINDNAPEFPFTTKEQQVEEDTRVNSTVIPEAELQATDRDKDSILFYTLQEVTPGAGSFFSLLGVNRPALRLDRALDFYKWQNMTFQLLVRDTREEHVTPSHTATATLVLKVLPADLRPPWFLPCSYSDGYVCIQAQYQGAIPTGHRLPSPLTLRPGPIYAVDGDQGINQRVIYSIIGGNEDNTFAIGPDSGNLTMTKSVPSPTTFLLVVKGEQADLARYSVTQVTVDAHQATGSQLYFPQSLYRGTVAPGSGAGVAVKDTASPSQPLRIWAQDPEFPNLNSAITYRITNCSEFQMSGETVLTTTAIQQAGVFYAEVEAKNTVTAGVATTVVEIRVSGQEPPSTGIPGSSTADVAAEGGPKDDQRFSTVDMAVLGGVLGALLLLALMGLVVLIHKHYGHRLNCCSGKVSEPQPRGFDNRAFLGDHEANWAPAPSSGTGSKSVEVPPESPSPVSPGPESPSSESPGPAPLASAHESPAAARAGDSPSAVRSILTKERRPEGGYKAVWFGEDIGAEADVVVLNAPSVDADGAGDSGSEGSSDQVAVRDWGPRSAPDDDDDDSTYI
ncbi:Cadherin-related family member 5 [Sciurus carolinensis]|uniref:Cadherin-related family member 5 n=1 Tax=Sciurus carolinensis TaxID=30640 RepID=A0AA41ME38_SCICA|nr:Cadherin-related family member 5 [Sciurus carolinensis]